MRKIKFLLIVVISFFATSVFAQNDNFKLPEYETVKLDNGLTVYLMEQHEVPLIYVSTIFSAGAVYDNNKNGLASLTAENLLYGTKNFTKDDIEGTFDFYGASINANAGMESASINITYNKKDQDKLLPIFADVIMNPVFPKDEFEKRQQRWLVELEQQRESPRSVIGNYYRKLIYNDNPYGNPVDGIKSTVSILTDNDLKEFYSTHYKPYNSAIAVVGDFKTSEMKATIENLFNDWNSEKSEVEKFDDLSFPELTSNNVLLVNKDDSHETTFYIGGYGVSFNNPDFTDIQVVNTILGGRFTSWLNDALRVNAGLTYGARSFFAAYKNTGTFAIYSFTATPTTIEAIDLALEVYNRLLKEGIDQKTLESAKKYMKGQFPPDYETSGDLARFLTQKFFYNLDDSYINGFEKRVDEMTVDRAKEIIRKYFPADNLQFVLIGKASEIKDKVAKYGTVIEKEIKGEGY